MKIVIPSRKRVGVITACALRLVPDAYVCVHESERDDYAAVVARDRLVCHQVVGLPAIRNFILDTFGDDLVIMIDDDISHIEFHLGEYRRTFSRPDEVMAIIDNTAEMASGFGAKLFGWAQNGHVMARSANKPFTLSRSVGGVVGVFPNPLRYDPKVFMRDDTDYALQHLLKYRVVFRDDRFVFLSKNCFRSGGGGNAMAQSHDNYVADKEYLKQKWGKYIVFAKSGTSNSDGSRVIVKRMYED